VIAGRDPAYSGTGGTGGATRVPAPPVLHFLDELF